MRENLDPKLWSGNTLFCGVDEAGRGALAGPVVAAAVVLPIGTEVEDVDDSKKLTPAQRERVDLEIRKRALSYAIGQADHRYIDRHNVHQATFHAMRLAIRGLKIKPALAVADGWPVPRAGLPCDGLVDGDERSISIACASILAKVFRDRLMVRLAKRHPGYGLENHKGYGTPEHLRALELLGPTPVHRLSFAPVKGLRVNAPQ